MANREACEVFIDEEIKEGLKEGKTPHALGRELSDWISKKLQAHVPPETIRSRARRQKSKQRSKDRSDATPQQQTEKKDIQEIKSENKDDSWTREDVRGKHGGMREGAGRPRKGQPASDAKNIVDIIISELDRISDDDPKRSEELQRLHEHLTNLIRGE